MAHDVRRRADIRAVSPDHLDSPVDPWFLWSWFLWRPQLHDPGDELVLDAAVNGRAQAIVTFNRRDFRPAADRFGLDILLPSEALRSLP